MDKLLVAKISKPQGIKGELKCQVLTDVLALFNGKVQDFFVDGKEMLAERISLRQGDLYIKFRGIETRNDAELYRDKMISVPKEILEDFLEDDFLVGDLIGKVLYDENGEKVGQIVDYEDYGASGILTILENGHQYEIPLAGGFFIKSGKDLIVKREEYNDNKI